MTNEERIAHNAAEGFTLVYTGDGFEVYKKKNEVGGWTYYSDFIGCEGHYVIWDDCIRGKEELIAIAKDCYNLNCHTVMQPFEKAIKESVENISDQWKHERYELQPGESIIFSGANAVDDAVTLICAGLDKNKEPGSMYENWRRNIAKAFCDTFNKYAEENEIEGSARNFDILEISNTAATNFLNTLCQQQKNTGNRKPGQ